MVHDRTVSPQKVTWNYEVFRNGRGITPDSAPVKQIALSDLSAESRQTINELDALAVHMVNRRYVDAMVKVSK